MTHVANQNAPKSKVGMTKVGKSVSQKIATDEAAIQTSDPKNQTSESWRRKKSQQKASAILQQSFLGTGKWHNKLHHPLSAFDGMVL
jgi:hypothetical protein